MRLRPANPRSILVRWLLGAALLASAAAWIVIDRGSKESEPSIFLPPPGKRLIALTRPLEEVSDAAPWHRDPGAVVSYSALGSLPGITTPANVGAGTFHLDALAQRYPNSALILGLYVVGQLEEIASGALDQRIAQLQTELRRYERPVYLRFGYEFDGPWNAYEPSLYVAAWKHFRARLRQARAQHVTMVWQSAAHCGATYQNQPTSAWYPGDDQVDWVGLSYFSPNACGGLVAEGILYFARQHKKPVMIAESAPRHYDLANQRLSWDGKTFHPRESERIWRDWFRPLFDLVDRNPDLIRIVTYINTHWDAYPMWNSQTGGSGYWGNSRIEENATVRERWSRTLGEEVWLHGGPGLFERLGYQDRGA